MSSRSSNRKQPRFSLIEQFRRDYHRELFQKVIRVRDGNIPNMADKGNVFSIEVSRALILQLAQEQTVATAHLSGQTAGGQFEKVTLAFLQRAFTALSHVRPGQWVFAVQGNIADFDQYAHLNDLAQILHNNPTLRTVLGDYVIKPDIVISRQPASDDDLNINQTLVHPNGPPYYSPLRARNAQLSSLHASISCKWTLRSDRAQNARTEGLNLIRHRKGHTPHILVITGEPLPSRLASLALGTGDMDCVYHFALDELRNIIQSTGNSEAVDTLENLIQGRRLRDIADLPFDLAV